VWVNELRLDNVQRNVSTAGQLNVAATLSDLATFSFGIEGRDADFVQIGQSRGTGINDRRLRWDTSLNMDRFVPRLNLRIPLRYSYSRTTQEPKFQTGSDIVFEGANRELNVSQNITRTFSTEYSRTPSENPLLRYTIDGIRAGFSRDERKSVRPTAADSTVSWRASVNYNISAPYHPLVRLPLGMELDYMPSSFSASGQNTESETRTWQRSSSDLTEPLEFQNQTDSRSRTLSWSTSYRALVKPNVNYQFQSTRDLLRSGPEPLGVNVGLETNRSESLAAGYAINAIPDATATAYPVIGPALATVVNKFLDPLNPSVNWSGRSSSSVDVSRLASGGRPRSIQNSTSTTVRGRVPVSGIMRALRNAARSQVSGDDDDDEEGESSGGRRGRGKGTRRTRDEPETGRDDEDLRGRGEGDLRGRDGQQGAAQEASDASPFGMNVSIGDVTAQYTRTRSSNHTLVAGDPSLKYRLGFTRELNPDIRRLASNTSARSDSDVYTLSSTGKLSNLRFGGRRIRTALDVKASFTDENSGRVSTSLGSDLTTSPPTLSLTDRRTWPDLQFTATGVEDAVPFLSGKFRRVTLTSRFTKSEDVTGDQIVPRRRVTSSTDWSPFLSIETTMKSGLRLTARRNTRSSDVRASGVVETLSKLSSSDLTFSVQHTLERKRSVDLPFGQGKRILTTRIDIALNVSRRTQKNATVDANTGRETVLTDTRDFNASAELGYNFTKNIHGTGRVNYGERKDLKTLSNTSRTLGITLTATFQF